jgi:predicted dehydrogenase
VLGYGYWGSKHVRVLRALADVDVVVIEQHVDRLAAAGRDFPGAILLTDLESALSEVDAVIVATAASSHMKLASACLEAGVHVLVEKPLATSATDAQSLIDLAAEKGLVLMVGHTFEYNPSVRLLHEMIRDGVLGDIRYVDTARLNLGLYQPDVNVIWDLAPHDVSIINYLLESSPTHVSAWARGNVIEGVEDVAHLQLEYEQPALNAYVHVSWLDPKKVRRVTVVGSEKMAVYNDVDPNEPIRVYDMGVDVEDVDVSPNRPLLYRYGDIWSPRVDGSEPLAAEDQHFVDCIRSGQRPVSDGLSGLAVVKTIEAAIRSTMAEGARVPLSSHKSNNEQAA